MQYYNTRRKVDISVNVPSVAVHMSVWNN